MLQASPEFKGIKTPSMHYPHRKCFKPALNSKGLRRLNVRKAIALDRFKPALNSKGLRRSWRRIYRCLSLQASPEFKGIKTWSAHDTVSRRLQASPEFKGIKTVGGCSMACHPMLQASPEFKGIKTPSGFTLPSDLRLQASPEFKGIKTEIRALLRATSGLQASPEFKGIKTPSP